MTAKSSAARRCGPVGIGNDTIPPSGLAEKSPDRGAANPAPISKTWGGIVTRSPAMRESLSALERFASTDVTITLSGETGSGKDVVAHAVHAASRRAGGPFVVFDCGAVAPNLAESELLGHERGAFTGAVAAHAGAFERGHGGTLFLDEVAELPLDLQPRLLRALESQQVRRVGGKTVRSVDTRVIAATHRDLRAEVAAGRFRQDLYFRLAVAVVVLPPLRHRLEDLPVLVRALLADLGGADLFVSSEAMAVLGAHTWPGNVRELKNVLSCAVALVDRGRRVIEPRHLRMMTSLEGLASPLEGLALGGRSLEGIERVAIHQTMVQADGDRACAARALGIPVASLHEKIRKYGL
ncbi:MAG: sigma-54 dependent transcriptional regulator [Polyangiaceae bacterium]